MEIKIHTHVCSTCLFTCWEQWHSQLNGTSTRRHCEWENMIHYWWLGDLSDRSEGKSIRGEMLSHGLCWHGHPSLRMGIAVRGENQWDGVETLHGVEWILSIGRPEQTTCPGKGGKHSKGREWGTIYVYNVHRAYEFTLSVRSGNQVQENIKRILRMRYHMLGIPSSLFRVITLFNELGVGWYSTWN